MSRGQTEKLVGMVMLVVAVSIGLMIFTVYLNSLASERQSTLSGQITLQQSRTSYRTLLEVQDDFGNSIGDLLRMAVATDIDETFTVSGEQIDKRATIGGSPCSGVGVKYPSLCCGSDTESETRVFLAAVDYDSTYDISEYGLLNYVQCYLIPKNFYPIFGNNYKVTTVMGTRIIETGNTKYTGTSGQSFYLAAPAGNAETLVQVTIVGEVQ